MGDWFDSRFEPGVTKWVTVDTSAGVRQVREEPHQQVVQEMEVWLAGLHVSLGHACSPPLQ